MVLLLCTSVPTIILGPVVYWDTDILKYLVKFPNVEFKYLYRNLKIYMFLSFIQ